MERPKILSLLLILGLAAGCTLIRQEREPYSTSRDKTRKGAGYGAAAGAVAAVLAGEREADEILAGAAIGAVAGGAVGAYMDRQEEKLARIPGTTVERVGPGVLLVHFDSSLLFDVDSAALRPPGRTTLEQAVTVLVEFRKTALVVQGHTDSTGSAEHNEALSRRRAESAQNFLIGRGIDRERITAVGYGEGYAIASNETADGRQRNRRVDLLIKANAT